MSEKVIINKPDMVELANEIRSKAGKTNSMNLKQLKNAVSGITGGEDVSAEIAEYAVLNNELESVIDGLPSAGGSDGGSVNTCTIQIVNGDSQVDYFGICATIVNNGVIETRNEIASRTDLANMTIENVVCGSSFILFAIGWLKTNISVSGNVTCDFIGYDFNALGLQRVNVFSIGNTPNSTSTITMYGGD